MGDYGGNLYIDLCDATWRAVEITPNNGWHVIEKPPLKLLRSPSMRPLREPEGGSLLEEFRHFFNVNDDDFMLVIAFLVAALRPHGPYSVLVLNGEQGSGKSVLSRIVRSLVDPSAAPFVLRRRTTAIWLSAQVTVGCWFMTIFPALPGGCRRVSRLASVSLCNSPTAHRQR